MAKARPVKLVTLDTETIGLDGALKRIAIYDGDKIRYGYTFPDIAPYLIDYYRQGYQVHVYIHNLDFDARKIPEIFEPGNVKWSQTKKIGTKYAKIVCRHYTMHDSFKILPMALEKLSKDFGLEHGKLDLWDEVQKEYPGQYTDKVDFLNRCHPDDELYLRYLGYDAISLYELLYKIMDVSGIPENNFVKILSTASMSRYLFKNGCKGVQFKSPDRDKTDFEILTSMKAWSSEKKVPGREIEWLGLEYKMREGFYGGRTEVFTPYAEYAYHYDVNSLYPSVMLLDYPVGYPEYETEPVLCENIFSKWRMNHRGLGFIKAKIHIPQQTIPPLPVKMGKLAFVCGYVAGTWTFTELEYAIEHCGVTIVEYEEVVFFKNTYPVFKNFVLFFYDWKENGKRQGNDAMTAFAKLILNTAYGWTVLRRDDKTALRDIKDIEKWQDTDNFIFANEDMGYFEIWDKVVTDTIQVQIGAYVTSYARLTLLRALIAQATRGTVYYCDTDSIVCAEPLPPEMVDAYKIGYWDLEKEIHEGYFLQPKVYFERTTTGKQTKKFKGISRRVVDGLDVSFYEELYGDMQAGAQGEKLIEKGRETLPSLSVSQKRGENPNRLKLTDKKIKLGTKQKRDIDYRNNQSVAWYMESYEAFYHFDFAEFQNRPTDKNLFGG